MGFQTLIFSHGEHGVHGEYLWPEPLTEMAKYAKIHNWILNSILAQRRRGAVKISSASALALALALALSQHIPIQPIKQHQFIIRRIETDQTCDRCIDLIRIQDR